MTKTKTKAKADDELVFVPLGGAGEIGMNLTLSVCVVQALTDFVDRMIVLAVVLVILPAVHSAFGSLSMRSRK